MQRQAHLHVLNAVALSLHLVGGELKARTDVSGLLEWLAGEGVPPEVTDRLIERSVRSGMPVDIGGLSAEYVKAERAAAVRTAAEQEPSKDVEGEVARGGDAAAPQEAGSEAESGPVPTTAH